MTYRSKRDLLESHMMWVRKIDCALNWEFFELTSESEELNSIASAYKYRSNLPREQLRIPKIFHTFFSLVMFCKENAFFLAFPRHFFSPSWKRNLFEFKDEKLKTLYVMENSFRFRFSSRHDIIVKLQPSVGHIHLRVWIVRSRLNKLNERLMLIDFSRISFRSVWPCAAFYFCIISDITNASDIIGFCLWMSLLLPRFTKPTSRLSKRCNEGSRCSEQSIISSSVAWIAVSITFNCLVWIDADDGMMLSTAR